MKNSLPLVSVIMPVFNSAEYLDSAINSILNQTYENIELLIIDDGSSDKSVEIINSFDSLKIKFFQNEKNIGVSATRNRAIDLSKGKYLALMDSDDISPNYRIGKQVDFLEKNSDYGLIGGHYERFSTYGFFKKRKIYKQSLIQEENQVRLNFMGSIAAPTAMFRSVIVKENNLHFDINLKIAEDYDFWRRIGLYSKVTNIDEILIYYRKHSNNTMNKKELAYIHTTIAIRKSFDNLEISNSDIFKENQKIKDIDSFFKLVNNLDLFTISNKISNRFNQIYLEKAIDEIIIWFYKSNLKDLGFELDLRLKKTRFFDLINPKLRDRVKKLKYILQKRIIKSAYKK
jgi:glycosyltransferase involved in cell wall biosynthesis